MRHRKSNKKINLPTDQRLALLKSLSKSLIEFKRIKTTRLRAKQTQSYVEKIITLAKENSLQSRRHALKLLPNKDAVAQLFQFASEKFKDRNGGYTRIIHAGNRSGDAAEMSILEFVD